MRKRIIIFDLNGNSLLLMSLDMNARFYQGKKKALACENKTSCDIIVNGLATALLKYQGGFKQCLRSAIMK